jgi:hypothetical protein
MFHALPHRKIARSNLTNRLTITKITASTSPTVRNSASAMIPRNTHSGHHRLSRLLIRPLYFLQLCEPPC